MRVREQLRDAILEVQRQHLKHGWDSPEVRASFVRALKIAQRDSLDGQG